MSLTSTERTREDVLRELANLRAQAGRMTVKSAGYEPLHDAINDRLDELEALGD